MHVTEKAFRNRRSRLLTLSTKVGVDDLEIISQRASAAGLKLSPFLRQAAIAAKVKPAVILPSINGEQYLAMGKLAATLSQIAHPIGRDQINETQPELERTIERSGRRFRTSGTA